KDALLHKYLGLIVRMCLGYLILSSGNSLSRSSVAYMDLHFYLGFSSPIIICFIFMYTPVSFGHTRGKAIDEKAKEAATSKIVYVLMIQLRFHFNLGAA
ncbi:hypothetical protein ACJX0J_011835, partial [Zea mays]